MKKILFIAGTRPEAIKLAPLYLEMANREFFAPVFCATGQHSDLFDDGLEVFGITPDVVLSTMLPGQSLAALTSALLGQIATVLKAQRPDLVVVQGDTMSAFSGAWAGFLSQVPVVHIEAGLRTYDMDNPYPEEANRRAITLVARYHMAPTEAARQNLLNEGVPGDRVFVTGNTAIDALMHVKNTLQPAGETDPRPRILVTGHRRESFGEGLVNICHALREIAEKAPGVMITYAVHPNPAVAATVRRELSGIQNIELVDPLAYQDFVRMMIQSKFIISDSGGVQEEAPALGRPVLVTRTVTERPEAVELGATRLIGTASGAIVEAAMELLNNPDQYRQMAQAGSPYGDGRASATIANVLTRALQVDE